MSLLHTPLTGFHSLSVWATGHDREGWGDGTLGIQIDLSPDNGVTWLPYATITADTIEPLPVLFGVLLRTNVIRIKEQPSGGFKLPWVKAPTRYTAPVVGRLSCDRENPCSPCFFSCDPGFDVSSVLCRTYSLQEARGVFYCPSDTLAQLQASILQAVQAQAPPGWESLDLTQCSQVTDNGCCTGTDSVRGLLVARW